MCLEISSQSSAQLEIFALFVCQTDNFSLIRSETPHDNLPTLKAGRTYPRAALQINGLHCRIWPSFGSILSRDFDELGLVVSGQLPRTHYMQRLAGPGVQGTS